jgi:hypothetical protein
MTMCVGLEEKNSFKFLEKAGHVSWCVNLDTSAGRSVYCCSFTGALNLTGTVAVAVLRKENDDLLQEWSLESLVG